MKPRCPLADVVGGSGVPSEFCSPRFSYSSAVSDQSGRTEPALFSTADAVAEFERYAVRQRLDIGLAQQETGPCLAVGQCTFSVISQAAGPECSAITTRSPRVGRIVSDDRRLSGSIGQPTLALA
jgi:hypothetical protein